MDKQWINIGKPSMHSFLIFGVWPDQVSKR